MRTVLVVATLVSLALAGTVPSFHSYANYRTENVDASVVGRQYRVLELLQNIDQSVVSAGYYTIGQSYDIKAHIDHYENPEVVNRFLIMMQHNFLPRNTVFSIFNDQMREQAMAMFDLFYYAKDFETFYNTAAWARVHFNQGMFAYTFYVAVIQRTDTADLVLPPFYEIFPQFYVNLETMNQIYYGRMRGEPFEEYPEYGIVQQGNYHFYYQNYSDYLTYGEEYRLSYLTEDIGWNSYYTYFHVMLPFWLHGDRIGHGAFTERRGEIYYHFYQQLLARYYLERLSNGMGEIPTFSWYQPFQYGFRPLLTTGITPFAQRSDNYVMQNQYYLDDLSYVCSYENMFLSFLEQGQFTAFNRQIDFANENSINFVGNFWQTNPDLYAKLSPRRNYFNSYERAARRILGGALPSYNYEFLPSALDFYQTSLRDPAFYQIYNRIWSFMAQYKQYLPPYTQEDLHYVGVRVNKVEVSHLETFFDFHYFNVSNGIFYPNQELASGTEQQYAVMQSRLNHESFNVTISVKSEVEEQATFKVFMGPRYDSYGHEMNFENNWMNFVELDWFSHALTKGENVIVRSSNDFFFYSEDALSIGEIYNLLGEGKLPYDMIYNYDNLPNRLMLPRGTASGFPLQIFVVVYKSQGLPQEMPQEHTFFLDERPLGYPLDRPVTEYFFQPNMYVQDVVVHHRGSEYPIGFDVVEHSNVSTQH